MRFKRRLHKFRVDSRWRQGVWITAFNRTDFVGFVLVVPYNVGWHQRINMPLRNEVSVSDISVVHWVIVIWFPVSFASFFDFMSELWLSSIDIGDVHLVPCSNGVVFLFTWSGTFNIINVHLMSQKFKWFRWHRNCLLQCILRI